MDATESFDTASGFERIFRDDGVLLWGDLHPVTVHRLLGDLVPILRRRGILRTEYAAGGLHANLRAF